MALKRVWIPSPNYSSRGGAAVRLIVLHTAEGARNYSDLGAFFARSSTAASSQVGIDDTAGTVGEYVKRTNKPWTQKEFNGVSDSAELCAFAKWDLAEWNRHPNMLANTAAWIAEEAKAFAIPVVKLTAAQAQAGAKGICQHVDLGSRGGGHWDCGPAFPMDRVLEMARGDWSPAPAPPLPIGDDVFIIAKDGKTYWFIATASPYWRPLPPAAAARVKDRAIPDPNNDLLSLWKVGA